MLPLGNESKGIYSQYSQPLTKQSAGITWELNRVSSQTISALDKRF